MDEPARTAELSPDRITALWRRLKDHRIAQWTIGYVAVAYGIQHAVTLTSEAFKWPDEIIRVSMLLLALGLPIAITLAWYHGERAARWMSAGEFSILAVLLVCASILFYAFVHPSGDSVTAAAPAVQEASVTAARAAAASPKGAISVAVLPFLNLSSDKEQEFFSDGMTEEITAALAKVPDLRVVARTSAFEFKGKNVDVQQIGAQLHATHLIEGSVRKAGDKLRITAQLIKADDGTHLWAEDYDRQLTDVFQIQEDIARAIANSLRMPLGLKPGQNLVSSRNINPEIYQEFLRIRAKRHARTSSAIRVEAAEEVEKLLSRAPNFAKAWAFLANVYFEEKLQRLYADTVEPPKDAREQLLVIYDKAKKAAREAIRLDETEAPAYSALARVEYHRSNWVAAEDLFRKGLIFDPYDPDILFEQSLFLAKTGRIKQALPVMQEVHDLEPLSDSGRLGLSVEYLSNNQPDAVIALLEGATNILFGGASALASSYAMKGQFNKAADRIVKMGGNLVGRHLGQASFEDAARLLRSAPHKVADPKALPPLHEFVSFIYAYVGAEDRLLDFAERESDAGLFSEVRYLFTPAYSPARKTERFKTLVRKAGLVDYWKARGWPDVCRPVGADDFACS